MWIKCYLCLLNILLLLYCHCLCCSISAPCPTLLRGVGIGYFYWWYTTSQGSLSPSPSSGPWGWKLCGGREILSVVEDRGGARTPQQLRISLFPSCSCWGWGSRDLTPWRPCGPWGPSPHCCSRIHCRTRKWAWQSGHWGQCQPQHRR